MINPLHVPKGETKTIRVFGFTGSGADFQTLTGPEGTLTAALGATHLDETAVETFDVADLGDLGLPGYLAEGNGIPADQIAAHQPALDNVAGHVILVYANAFGGIEQTLIPAPNLEFVGVLREPGTDWSAQPLSAESAKPYSAPKPSPREARNRARRIGATLFGVIMSLIILIVLWMIF